MLIKLATVFNYTKPYYLLHRSHDLKRNTEQTVLNELIFSLVFKHHDSMKSSVPLHYPSPDLSSKLLISSESFLMLIKIIPERFISNL